MEWVIFKDLNQNIPVPVRFKIIRRLLTNLIDLQAEIQFDMSDSGTDSTSTEGYDEGNRLTSAGDEVTSSRYSHHSSGSERQKSAANSIFSGEKSPRSPLTDGESKSPRSPPLSPKSQRSGIMSPSEEGSPRSIRSLSKSPPPMSPPQSPESPAYRPPTSPTYQPNDSPKSYHSGNNSLDSPLSDQSLSRSPIQDNGSCLSPSNDSKSMRFEDAESKASDLETDMQRSVDNSLKSYSYKNSESRQSSPKSPRSGPSSVKSLISARSSPKSFKSGPASPMDDHESDKPSPMHSGPRSPEEEKNGSYNELDGEQISDGDIEDEPEPMSKSKPTPMTHSEDLSDVSDLESIDGPEDSNDQNIEIDKAQEQTDKEITNDEENTKKEDKIAPVGLTEESEQLDFEADGQWKDERDEGKYINFKFQIQFLYIEIV